MRKHKRKEFGFPALLLMGAGFSLFAVVATSLVLAIISCFTGDPTSLTSAFSLLALILAGAISSFITARVNGEGGTLIGILSAVIASAVIPVVGLILRGGALPLSVILNVLAFLSASVLASLIGKKREKRTYGRR